jgi:hypothetical protein
MERLSIAEIAAAGVCRTVRDHRHQCSQVWVKVRALIPMESNGVRRGVGDEFEEMIEIVPGQIATEQVELVAADVKAVSPKADKA